MNDAQAPMCCERIALPRDGWARASYKNCTRKGKVERDGKWYCGQHDPIATDARRNAQIEKWRVENRADSARRKLERYAPEMLKLLTESQHGIGDGWRIRRDALLLDLSRNAT